LENFFFWQSDILKVEKQQPNSLLFAQEDEL
jgi:hypothetical protein